jgi:hypothetical protein
VVKNFMPQPKKNILRADFITHAISVQEDINDRHHMRKML